MHGWFIGSLLLFAAMDTPPAKPNVLLICVDDLKPVLGCYGDKVVKTPNIDRLASRSMRFDAAYCNQAVCSPSRNALLTGLRPQTLGIYDLGTNFRQGRQNAVTLPQWFKANGYSAQGMGKIFHVGHGNTNDEASWSVPFFRGKVVDYALPENKRELSREEAMFDNKSPANLPRGAALEDADVPDDTYSDGKVASEAIRRLEAAAKNPGEPVFLAVGFLKPHLPFCAPRKYWDLYKTDQFQLPAFRRAPEGAPAYAPTAFGELRNYKDVPDKGEIPEDLQRKLIHGYHAATSYMDAQVGKVLDALDASPLKDNTVIVLWGDHGWHLGDHGMWSKHTNYEQATRVPLIIHAPGQKRAGGRASAPVEFVDLFPTLCELADLPAPPELEGQSLAPVLDDPTATIKPVAVSQYPRQLPDRELMGYAFRTDRYRYIEWRSFDPSAPNAGGQREPVATELYDYHADPAENRNLADDPGSRSTVAEMKRLAADYWQTRQHQP